MISIEVISFYFFIFLALIFIPFWIAISLAIYDELGFSLLGLAGIVDGALLFYCIWNALRMGFFFINIASAFSYLCRHHMKELRDKLGLIILIQPVFRRPAALKGKFLLLSIHLSLFQKEYHRLQSVTEYTNRVVASKLMFVTFLTNIAVHVVLLNLLLIERMKFGEEAMILFIVAFETVLGLTIIQVLISWAGAFYTRLDHLIYRAQGIVRRRANIFSLPAIIVTKLRFQTFFELVCTKNKFHFTVGPISKINKRSLYEVCIWGSIFYNNTLQFIFKA